ncbi:hypothetical protein AMATHDRAFT_136453 [Amanita thiersii Skay4041]|uniref:AN1-type domain-containing protein n=1 Tax=Amanita thiersii Skay4041 TaxID=703135 RepID=A0A2A9NSW9_9AGAR|nr:hypothetical protein AMATHDRAFT_136453 [Amanita thiersii Skay4041]
MNSSASSTPAQTAERDAQLLSVGKQCFHSQCLLIDFLPFKCQHCQQSFCQAHFKVEDHQCPEYDESKHNRVAPNCPMCNTPVAIKQGQDPNARMEEHFARECFVMTGKASGKSMPTCSRGNCKKVLYTPITCDKCTKDFCATHRFAADHNCPSLTAPKPQAPSRNGAPHPLVEKFFQKKTTVGVASVRRTAVAKRPTAVSAAAKPSTTSTSQPTPADSASFKLSTPSPFNKIDRRAKEERASKVKAMQERAKKGLLSEREKAILAEEEAELAKDKDCIVM